LSFVPDLSDAFLMSNQVFLLVWKGTQLLEDTDSEIRTCHDVVITLLFQY